MVNYFTISNAVLEGNHLKFSVIFNLLLIGLWKYKYHRNETIKVKHLLSC